jgi:1-acyl-sn-glycerol-3-phosphate acyltransferase
MSEARVAREHKLREHRDERDTEAGARAPAVLPQWTFDLARPAVRALSRALWRMSFRGTENIPARGGIIIAANHQTYFDPFWISIPVRRPLRYLAWDEAFRWPMMGRPMRLLGAWPIQINGGSPEAIRRARAFLRDGGAVMIFPEGGRGETDGSMRKFKVGAMRLALEADVPILPVTIRGGHRVWPTTYRLPRLAPVEILYHKLFKVEPQASEDMRGCARRETDRLAQIIASALHT